mmetsp:Transcript_41923/g.40246  ORF Transcript_41923/g.40246 Transcript_41923/m.40246 type:complete len:110 (+) Transcript_41923:1191-1520(+)
MNSSYLIPGRIRVGDINADGFPDLLMSLSAQYVSTNQYFIHTTVMINTECDEGLCSSTDIGQRFFDDDAENYNTLNAFTLENTEMAAFYDIDEDGRLDVLIQKRNMVSG